MSLNQVHLLLVGHTTPIANCISTIHYLKKIAKEHVLRRYRIDGKTNSGSLNRNATTGNLDSITTPTGTDSFTYITGILSSAQSADGVTKNFSYWGRLLSQVNDYFNSSNTIYSLLGYTYNNDLLKVSDVVASSGTDSGATISYTYDNDNLTTGAGSEALTYDPATGLLSTTQLGNLTQSFTFSTDMGELSQIQAKYSGVVKYKEVLTRDSLVRIITKVETYGTTTTTCTYTYDATGRLTDVKKNGAQSSHYVALSTGARKVFDTGDGWTLATSKQFLTAQYEHTLVITKPMPLIMTLPA